MADENKSILSTIYQNQDLVLKITSGLNAKINNRVSTLSGVTDALSGALSGMLNDYNKAMKEAIPAIATTLYDFMKDTGTVLDGFLPSASVSSVLVSAIEKLESEINTTSSFISGKLGEWTEASGTVASRITAIEEEIGGGGGGGEGLGARVARLETATKIETTSGTAIINDEDKLARKYQADIASMTCASFDYNKIKFYGNCQVDYGTDGTIKIRIGEAVNCSLYNGTDGISKTTVTYTKSTNPNSTTISNDFTDITTGSRSTVYKKNNIATFTANAGTTETTSGGGSSNNGNEVHFEDNVNGKIRVTYADGKNAETEHSVLFDVIANGSTTTSGITLAVSNFKVEPKSSVGANGYCANINISWNPNVTFDNIQTDFRLVKVEQLENQTVVATWSNADSNVYCHLTDTTVPGTPATASYTISTVDTKTIGGVTFLKNSSKMSPSATGLTNVAYPATASNKVYCNYSGGNWFDAFNENQVTGLTDNKDVTMSWVGTAKNLKIGQYSDPQILVNGINFINSGSTKKSSEIDNAILVCDTNGYILTTHGSYTDASRKDGASETAYTSRDLTSSGAGSGDLQTYNGYIQYPNKDFSSFNKVTGNTNPNYSKCTGTRTAFLKVTKSGTIMNGTFTLTCSANPKTYFQNGSLKLELSKDGTVWRDVMNSAVGTSYDWNTISKIGFTIPQSTEYGQGYLYLKITMTGTTVGIGNIVLA